jgi:DNA-binding NtrC family response regulator
MRGAFSGAVATVDGKLLSARGGTVFLDEIDDTPLSVQTKLLRVLEDGAVTRVGESQARPADFRLVAATNRDLLKLVEEDKFGLDLYERLAIVRIQLPPLRERREDIPDFVRHFIARFYDSQGLPSQVHDVSARALAALHAHGWAGNIRELRNVIYQALVGKRSGCGELLLSDVRPLLDARQSAVGPRSVVDAKAIQAQLLAGSFNLRRERRALESQALTLALEQTGGRAAAAARLLGEVGRGASSDPGGTIRAMARRLDVALTGRAGTTRARGARR